MSLQWTFGRRLGAGFALAVAVLTIVAAAGYQSSVRQIENAKWVVHTHDVRRNLAALQSRIIEAESGARGFVISGDEQHLTPYRAAITDVRPRYESIRELTADNPTQQGRIRAAWSVIEAKLERMATLVETRRTQGANAATALVSTGEGADMMGQIRSALDEMDADEEALLSRRDAEARASEEWTRAVILWGSALGVLLVSLVGWWIASSVSEQIGAIVRHIQTSSAELQAAASQQAAGAKEQTTAMSEITTTISELMATSRQIAEGAARVALIAEQTATSARAGNTTVELGHSSLSDIRQQVELIVSHMVHLGEKSQQIGSILDITSELAEQTNILAINATIEAAGAGETGKRFAVVADEIRKLADRVSNSTKQIRGLIEEVRSAVHTTVMATETGSKTVDANFKQFAEVAAAFGQIASLVHTTTEASKEIHLSTQQQATAAEQVNLATVSVAQAAKESEVSTGQTFQTVTELTRLSGDLLRIVQSRAAA
jgi:methyl-accepting chemotaxis protein